jgi:3-hydroxyacyl-CoA dehydrogenase/enoyl-CoA hydratase/3-hydroxybutyryl-CoA epimerase/enoyl-CoA isomerase
VTPQRVFEGTTSLLLLEGRGWAWIGLDSVDGLHRLTCATLGALDRLFIDLRWRDTTRIALSGAPWMAGRSCHFSAGADLHEVLALEASTADAFARRGQRVMNHLAWPGWRTLTVASGAAMGGGCDLALHGQERWAVEGLRLKHPAARHGILTGFGGTVCLPEVLGEDGAARLFRHLETWHEQPALQAGAVHRVLKAESVRGAVLAWLSPEARRTSTE